MIADETRRPILRSDATYLVTGGLGALGLHVAQWLVESGARHLVLTSRHAALDDSLKGAIARLEQSGALISVVAADVSKPADVVKTVEEYGQWMASNDIPKLFISAEPGALLVGRAREFCRTWRNQQEVTVKGIHYVQEDSPVEIGRALESFVAGVQRGKREVKS